MAELLKGYLSAVGKRRPLVPVHVPGQAAGAFRAGANLAPDRAAGKRTWEEFLADLVLLAPRTSKESGAALDVDLRQVSADQIGGYVRASTMDSNHTK